MQRGTGRYPALKGRVDADVAIIGGGLSGLTSAVWLSQTGLRVALVEADTIGRGTSKACAGLISMAGADFAQLNRRMGESTAETYVSTYQRTYERIREWLEPLGMWNPIEMQMVFPIGKSEMDEEWEAMRKAGVEGITRTQMMDVPAISFRHSALLPARSYLQLLLETAEKQRVSLFEQSRVTSIETDEVHTQSGSVHAPYILLATGYPILNFPGWYFLWLTQRQYAWKKLTPGYSEGIFAESGRETMVFSTGTQQRMICRLGLVGSKENRHLEKQAEERIKGLTGIRPAGKWHYSSEVHTPDGLPVLGVYSPKTPNLFAASGYGGQGILGSAIAAQTISRKILGFPADEYEIYDGRRFWKQPWPMVCSAARYLQSTLFHARAPRCPHMGCRLILNPDTKLWECPCHGSSFDDIGHVIRSPAVHEAVLRDRK